MVKTIAINFINNTDGKDMFSKYAVEYNEEDNAVRIINFSVPLPRDGWVNADEFFKKIEELKK